VFLGENSRSQSGIGVSVDHWDASLHDYRSAVEFPSHEMYRGTSDLYPVLQRLTLSIQSGERWKKRGVDVQNGLRKRLEEWCADQPHVASQADEANVTRA